MENGNKNVCWGCRAPDHFLWECSLLWVFPGCGKGFVTFLKVVLVPRSMGKLFYGCTMRECDYFKWANVLKSKQEHLQPEAKQEAHTSGESLNMASSSSEMEYLSRIFSTAAYNLR